jgi:hypothetical protein
MMLTRKQVQDGEIIPRGYRVAYWDLYARRAYAYPLGIHWVVMAGRRVWQCSFWYRPSWVERLSGRVESLENELKITRELWRDAEKELHELRTVISNLRAEAVRQREQEWERRGRNDAELEEH